MKNSGLSLFNFRIVKHFINRVSRYSNSKEPTTTNIFQYEHKRKNKIISKIFKFDPFICI